MNSRSSSEHALSLLSLSFFDAFLSLPGPPAPSAEGSRSLPSLSLAPFPASSRHCPTSCWHITPNPYTSELWSYVSPSRTSGARYFGGPMRGVRSPRTSGRAADGSARANPKSHSLAQYPGPRCTKTLRALTSRCTCPAACSLASARATSARTRTRSTLRTTLFERSECATYSITMYSTPFSSNAPKTCTTLGCGNRRR